ncbi:MAG: alpha/beta fold hydrolase [Gemmatimonadaceae bacterium]|nr:alpha/beta fold hydrolase [Gemmatimonadaceae bacterium]
MLLPPPWLDRTAWPFAPQVHPHPDGDLHYVDEGRGPIVVLVHGTPTWSFEWRHVIRRLASRYRVLAPDHLGFGCSDRPAGARYRPEDHAERFRHWFDAVVGREACAFVVHDFGGPIAWPTILDNRNAVKSLVVLNSWCWDMMEQPALRRQARLLQGAFGRWMYRRLNVSQRILMPSGYGDRRHLTPEVHRQYLAVFPDAEGREQVLYALAQSLVQSTAFFSGLWHRRDELRDVPLHLIWGLKDGILPASLLARWRGGFPHAVVHELPAAGHWPHEEAPDDVSRTLLDVLARSHPASAASVP